MIIRKPYAFLIKHFRLLHFILLFLAGFISIKNIQLNNFINEFSKLGTYDAYSEPITRFISAPVIIAIFLIIIVSASLLLLFRHKGKTLQSWILYLFPVIEYSFMFIIFMSIKSFFNDFNGYYKVASLLAMKDFLVIAIFLQLPAIILFLIRAIGIDLKKFNFKADKEFLELKEEDREELEIKFDYDKHALKRGVKRVIRNLKYVYLEHKKFFNTCIIIFAIFISYSAYKFVFITNRAYKEGDSLVANGYTIKINKTSYTDKDGSGNIISKDSSFVIVDMSITNNNTPREIDLNKFHLMNGISKYETTFKTYGTEFADFGTTYEKKKLKPLETFRQIMVFKVSNKLKPKKFVLYYQEFNNGEPHLRKIKLKVNDLSNINKNKVIGLNEELLFKLDDEEVGFIFDEFTISDKLTYSSKNCDSCSLYDREIASQNGYKFLIVSFQSSDFEGKDMIDFSTKYGKIKYIDKDKKDHVIEIKNPLYNSYYGKYLYAKVPDDIIDASSISIEYIIRNNKYEYKLK